MAEEHIPPSMQIAADVTEEEYKKAKFQATVLWVGTMVTPLVALVLWNFGVRVVGWLVQAIGSGVGVYFLLYSVLPEAKKMSTMRMKKYKELRALRKTRERLAARKEAEEGS